MIRQHYEEELASLNREIMKMGLLAERALEKSIRAIKEKNSNLAQMVINDDSYIDDMEDDLCDRCALIIAKEQPVASNLRQLIGSIKIITDLERIGDYAVHMAKRFEDLSGRDIAPFLGDICEMADIGMEMLREAVIAFVEGDVEAAGNIAVKDEKLDKMYMRVYRKSVETIKNNEESLVDTGVSILQVIRYLERLGDHVKNICEWVFFAESGTHTEL